MPAQPTIAGINLHFPSTKEINSRQLQFPPLQQFFSIKHTFYCNEVFTVDRFQTFLYDFLNLYI
jgi:hypothetical protein